MKKPIYQNAKFLKSVAKINQLPPDVGMEVAFIGRSNAGKSSAINVLTQQKHLAKTSRTPGRTQLINYFVINDECQLVDLPGYGYAKVPEKVYKNWQNLIDQYLRKRKSLRGLILLMDIRHPMRDFDCQMIEWAKTANLPIHVLLTKADKLRYGARMKAMKEVSQALKHKDHISIQLFSASEKIGREELVEQLNSWFS